MPQTPPSTCDRRDAYRVDDIKRFLNSTFGRIDENAWRKPYLFGWTHGALGVLLTYANGQQLKPGYLFLQTGRCWERLSGLSQQKYYNDVPIYLDNADSEFLRGTDAGILWGALITGTAKRDLPQVIELLEIAKARASSFEAVFGEPAHHMSGAASLAFLRDFVQPISRFSRGVTAT
jgi:hypothetical protein